MHLGHVNIQVRNVQAAHDWYKQVLGLHTYQLVPAPPRSCPPILKARMRSR